MITGIVVALPQEISTLTARKVVKGQCVFLTDSLALAYSGAGASNAEAAAKLLIEQGATRLISWGCAGALSANLTSGDLVLADELIDADGAMITIDHEWHRRVRTVLEKAACQSSGFALRCGSLLESKTLVATSHDKQQLHRQSAAIALDMESVAVAKVAHAHALPFLVIRAIADPVTMDLPQAVSHALNEQGDVQLGKLLIFLLTHPSELKGLITLGQHFNAAKNTLKAVAQQLEKIIDTHSTIAH
ncbi:MAG: phosphorylase [Methylococcales bacterium]|nr:phosphorylase [Methylococcales bacterium]